MISKEEFNDLYYVIKNPTTTQQKLAEACLSAMYGDYMKLSSKSAQVFGHAPKSLDFEREYNDIVNGKKRNYMNYESL